MDDIEDAEIFNQTSFSVPLLPSHPTKLLGVNWTEAAFTLQASAFCLLFLTDTYLTHFPNIFWTNQIKRPKI